MGELMRKSSWKRMKWGRVCVCVCAAERGGGAPVLLVMPTDGLTHPEEGQEGPTWPLEPGGQTRAHPEHRAGAFPGASWLCGTPRVL